MPASRIEFEYVNNRWVIQIEASTYMGAKRETLYAQNVDEAFREALERYKIIAGDLEKQIAPKEPEGSELASILRPPSYGIDSGPDVALDDLIKITVTSTPSGSKVSSIDVAGPTTPTLTVSPDTLPPRPLRGRHPKTCVCVKCEAKRAA